MNKKMKNLLGRNLVPNYYFALCSCSLLVLKIFFLYRTTDVYIIKFQNCYPDDHHSTIHCDCDYDFDCIFTIYKKVLS